jgi:DeoR/GlpR family transcriptional regulator of sugar metabolism
VPELFADERRDQIAELIAVRGRVRIAELVAQFGVTDPTIRKDLAALEERNLLKRTYGGAIAQRQIVSRDLPGRAGVAVEEKKAIAQACQELISDGDTIFLDNGTTIEQLALALVERRRTDGNAPRATVLTNSLAVTQAVAETPGIEPVTLGGRFRPVGGTFVGPLTLQTIARFTPQTAFISVSGLAADGVTVVDLDEAHLKAAVIERAGQVVVAADHSKIGAIDFATVCPLSDIDVVVTDRASPELEALCATADVQLVVASANGGSA